MVTKLLMRNLSPEAVGGLRGQCLRESEPEQPSPVICDEAGLTKLARRARMHRGQPY
jgi:hypothetical protein